MRITSYKMKTRLTSKEITDTRIHGTSVNKKEGWVTAMVELPSEKGVSRDIHVRLTREELEYLLSQLK